MMSTIAADLLQRVKDKEDQEFKSYKLANDSSPVKKGKLHKGSIKNVNRIISTNLAEL